jgi:hypothetical protein
MSSILVINRNYKIHNMKNIQHKKYGLVLVLCVGVAVLSFFGGAQFGVFKYKKKHPINKEVNLIQEGGGVRMVARRNGTIVSGEVISQDDKSVTITTTSGTSKTIFFSPATRIEKTVEGKTSELVTGKELTVVGVNTSDGAFTATSIQIKKSDK